ncbi:TPA: hypothetical protein LGJ43_004794 [Escherichia coli]|nr:hypothetical protein [Escherichia coli]
MIQTRNQYLQFMLVMLAAWGISWGARFVMEQAVLLYGSGKNYLFFSHGRGLTLSGTKTHVKQRFLPLTPLLMVSDVLWSPVLPA